jgi:hypothetical protein
MFGNDLVAWEACIASVAGLFLLHRYFHSKTSEGEESSISKALAFAFAAATLIALPVVVWSGVLTGKNAAPSHHVSPTAVLMLAGYLDVAFLWLIWNINARCFSVRDSHANPWEEHWGMPYSPELKRRLLAPVFERLDRAGKLGNIIVDVGSGAVPVSGFLPAHPERKCILVDIAAKNEIAGKKQYLRLDIAKVVDDRLLSYRKAVARACQFLGKDVRAATPELADTLLFSDILNYVDFRKVLGGFAQFLQPGGRIIIANLPTRGIREQFSAQGLKRNEDLYPVLEALGLIIEEKQFPCRPRDATDESEEMIVLVARKRDSSVR